MTLREQIDQELTEAMRAKDKPKVSTLRILKSAIYNWQIAAQKEPQESDILTIIQKEIKSRQDSIILYQKGGREELAQKETQEIEILKKYLPVQLSEGQIRDHVKETISQTDANGPQDMGKVMGPLMEEFRGEADGAVVARIVKEELAK